MTWEEYYDKFYDWATSTQIKKLSQISTFGASSEVWEVAENLFDGKAASRLIKKTIINDVHFTGEEIEQMLYYVDIEVVNRAIQTAKLPLTEGQLYTLDGLVDADFLSNAAKKSGVSLEPDTFTIEPVQQETPSERRKHQRKEFWDGAAQTMMIDLFIDDLFGKKK